MKRVLILMVAASAGLLFGRSATAQGMSSANYKIPSSVVNSGGGTMSSANYTLIASIGEPVIGPTESAGYDLYAGFLAAYLNAIGMRGDVNRDGVINSADVRLLLQITGGLKNAADGDVDWQSGDVDAAVGDGKIDARDAARLLRYINGLNPTL